MIAFESPQSVWVVLFISGHTLSGIFDSQSSADEWRERLGIVAGTKVIEYPVKKFVNLGDN